MSFKQEEIYHVYMIVFYPSFNCMMCYNVNSYLNLFFHSLNTQIRNKKLHDLKTSQNIILPMLTFGRRCIFSAFITENNTQK